MEPNTDPTRKYSPRPTLGACYPPGHSRRSVSASIQAICAGLRAARDALDEIEAAVADLAARTIH